MSDYVDIVFDGPPGPEAGRFVEVEDADKRSIKIGKWVEESPYWRLRIPDPRKIEKLEAERDALLKACNLGMKILRDVCIASEMARASAKCQEAAADE